ncbi:MAG: SH3 domain-containing protein [Eubacteriales bacterium]|nr:SH3 domain-containing protein [Eubacteriales bacterium]
MSNSKTTKRLLTAMLSLSLAAAPLCAGQASEYATVKGGGLNLRQTASLDAKVLGQYWTGTWVEILEAGETWSKVKVDGKVGYMMSKYLNNGATGSVLYVRTNTGIGLNLRQGPSMDSAIITSFPINTAVTVLQRGTNWHKVQVSDKTGYMATRYLVSSKAPSYTKPVDKPFTATLKNINGGSVVNFRLYPGMKTKVLKVVPVGTKVTVLEMGENWSKVELDGQRGYVSTYFLKY